MWNARTRWHKADYEKWHKETDPEKLWQAIIKSHKVDCVSNVHSLANDLERPVDVIKTH